MGITLTGWLLAHLIGAAQGILMGGALLSKKRGNLPAQRLLALLLIVSSCAFSLIALTHLENFQPALYLESIEYALTLTCGPLLYFYARSLLPPNCWKLTPAIHFIPCVLLVVFTVFFYSGRMERWIIQLIIGHQMAYTLAALVVFIRLKKNTKNTDHTDSRPLYWLRNMLLVFMAIHSAQLVRFTFSDVKALIDVVPTTGIAGLYLIGFMAWRQTDFLPGRMDEVLPAKYQKSPLDKSQVDQLTETLLHFMQQTSPYRDGTLTLPELASRLQTPAHHLSQVINARLNQNFADFVNGYRIEEAKQYLLDSSKDRFSIAGIASEVGFNSRSTFYTVFKKHVGITPSEYKQQVNHRT